MAVANVLITRNVSQAASWVAALKPLDCRAECRATFQLESMVGESKAQRAIDDIDQFDWIVLTSGNGLRTLRRGVEARGKKLASSPAKFAVVGPATAKGLAAIGVEASVVASVANAEGLLADLSPEVKEGEVVLVVQPEVTRPLLVEGLTELGADVHAVPFYRNRPSDDVSEIADACDAGRYDVGVFTAPSAFEHLYVACGPEADEIFSDMALVAIGEVTAAAIRDRGLLVAATAVKPTAEGLADAVERALNG